MKNLRKYLTDAGIASRRKAEEIIMEGRVRVDDKVILTPQQQIPDGAKITFDHAPIKKAEKKVCYMLNKPAGYICSHKRRRKKDRLVYDFFHMAVQRLFTVGRLDKDTSGLIIITNDGQLAHDIIHPSNNITKEYVVKSSTFITPHHLTLLSQGCEVEDVFVKPVSVAKVRNGTVKIVVKEGRNREVRALMEHAGLNTISLTRTRIGNLMLGNLREGHYLPLTDRKKAALFNQ